MTILLSALPPSWRPFITTQTNLAGLSLLMLIGEILQEDIMWQSSVAPDAPTIPPSLLHVLSSPNNRGHTHGFRGGCTFSSGRGPQPALLPTPNTYLAVWPSSGRGRNSRNPTSWSRSCFSARNSSQANMANTQPELQLFCTSTSIPQGTHPDGIWYLDIVASQHISPNWSWFQDSTLFAEPLKVYLSDHRRLLLKVLAVFSSNSSMVRTYFSLMFTMFWNLERIPFL